MDNTEKVSWLWPFKGGTWRERRHAMRYGMLLVLMAVVLYRLFWTLAP